MRCISLSELPLGSTLSKPVYGASGVLLLRSGTQVTPQVLEALSGWGIHSVYVDDGANPPVAPAVVRTTYCEAVGRIKVAMVELRRGGRPPLADLGRELARLVLKLVAEPGVIRSLHLLREWDEYTFHHCIDVAVVASLIGQWLGLAGADLQEVATAGALHDVGKARVPLEILNKPGSLTPQEFAVVKTHTTLGHELLAAEFGGASTAARVALEHHERGDGRGYPGGLRAEETLLASRIVAVADVYGAMTSRRVYRDRCPEFAVLNQLQEGGCGLLDRGVVTAFLEHVVHQAHGRRVRLSNGQVGRVVFIPEQAPSRPMVEVGLDLINLLERPDLFIVDEVDES